MHELGTPSRRQNVGRGKVEVLYEVLRILLDGIPYLLASQNRLRHDHAREDSACGGLSCDG